MTKVDIISGFLGAGKTTLISKLLKEALKDEQVVLIENEFGEIGIDGGFLKDSGVEIREMNSGCICCSLVGDFGTSLKEVVDKYHPDRIIIEPSGVGKLSDVIKAVKDLHIENEIRLNSASTVADASKVKVYMKNFGEFFNNQIEHAGTIILSRTQNVSEDKLKKAIELIRTVNANAHIITTPWDDLEGTQILGAMENVTNLELEMLAEAAEKAHEEHEHEHHHHHDGEECCCGHHHDEENTTTIMTTMRTNTNITITDMTRNVAADMTMTTRNMNIIITTMMANVAADMTITMKDIIMQMTYSQAGVQKHRINMIKQHLKVF